MTIQEWIDKQRRLIQELKEKDKPLEVATRTVMAMQAKRIFIEGRKSDGSQIGQYDTTRPLYINPDLSPRKTANKAKGIQGLKKAGKYGDTVFKNGKAHKTAYVENYKDFRNRIGRRIDRVDLTLSGDLQSDFRNSVAGSNNVVPKRINAHEYQLTIKRDINQKKIEGLEKKYGRFMPLTKAEHTEFIRVAEFELRKHFAK